MGGNVASQYLGGPESLPRLVPALCTPSNSTTLHSYSCANKLLPGNSDVTNVHHTPLVNKHA